MYIIFMYVTSYVYVCVLYSYHSPSSSSAFSSSAQHHSCQHHAFDDFGIPATESSGCIIHTRNKSILYHPKISLSIHILIIIISRSCYCILFCCCYFYEHIVGCTTL